MSRALVTGATGFVGSHLAEELLGRGWTVRCTARGSSNTRWLDGLAVERVALDLRDPAAMPAATRDVDVVFHVAGVLSGATAADFEAGNVRATEQLLAATPAGTRFVYVSSLAACGPNPDAAPLDERALCRPISLYGRSKRDAEEAVHRGAGQRTVTIVRPPAVYGPRDEAFLQLVRTLAAGWAPHVGGKKRVSVVHVRDLVRGIADAAGPAGAGETFSADPTPVEQSELRRALPARPRPARAHAAAARCRAARGRGDRRVDRPRRSPVARQGARDDAAGVGMHAGQGGAPPRLERAHGARRGRPRDRRLVSRPALGRVSRNPSHARIVGDDGRGGALAPWGPRRCTRA